MFIVHRAEPTSVGNRSDQLLFGDDINPSSHLMIKLTIGDSMKRHVLSLFLIAVYLFVPKVYAQTVTIKDSSRPFSVKPPNSWVRESTSTGNSRVKFVSPPDTPPAECAVIVKELFPLQGFTQQELDKQSLELVSLEGLRQHLSSSYNNVQVFTTGVAEISGYPAQTVQFEYSTGTPDGELWARAFTSTTKTTPGIVWTITCGALGYTPEDAQKGYSYWQSEMVKFPTHVKIFNNEFDSSFSNMEYYLNNAELAYEAGDKKIAKTLYLKASEMGSAEAHFSIAYKFAVTAEESIFHFSEAAKMGHKKSLEYALDALFFRANSLKVANPQKALELYKLHKLATGESHNISTQKEDEVIKTISMCAEPRGFDAEEFMEKFNVKDEDEAFPFYDIWELAEEASRGGRFGEPNPELVLNLVCRGGAVPAEVESAVSKAYENWKKGVVEEFDICDHITGRVGLVYCSKRTQKIMDEANSHLDFQKITNSIWISKEEEILPTCLEYEWPSSDNYEEYIEQYPTALDFIKFPGKYWGTVVPINPLKASWGDFVSLPKKLSECNKLLKGQQKKVDRNFVAISDPDERWSDSYRLMAKWGKEECSKVVPGFTDRCNSLVFVNRNENYPLGQGYYSYALITSGNEDYIVPVTNRISLKDLLTYLSNGDEGKTENKNNQKKANEQFNLGYRYAIGENVPQDYAEAIKLFGKAAAQGHIAAQYNLGYMYKHGMGVSQDYSEAAKWFSKAAEQGEELAQNNLAVMYYDGRGVPQDYVEAIKWHKKAARQGNVNSQRWLGLIFKNGEGVPQNYAEAAKWYRKAAEQGDSFAQNNLAVMYGKGQGVPQNYAEAAKWYRKAAEQGESRSQFNLGGAYEKGQGVPQDYVEAVKWYRKSAEQGDTDGQVKLGLMYAEGHGVPQDYILAYGWWNIAAAKGDNGAAKNRELIIKKMTAQQITEGQVLSKKLFEKYGKVE